MKQFAKWATSLTVAMALCGGSRLAVACDKPGKSAEKPSGDKSSVDDGIAKAEAAVKAAQENLTKAKAAAAKAAEEKAAREKAEKEKAAKEKAAADAAAQIAATGKEKHHHDEPAQTAAHTEVGTSTKADALLSDKLTSIAQKLESLNAALADLTKKAESEQQRIEAVAQHDSERAHRYQSENQAIMESLTKRLSGLESELKAIDQKTTTSKSAEAEQNAKKH